MKELSEFVQLVNFNLFTFKNELATNIQNMKNELALQFENTISLKMQELKEELKQDQIRSSNQIKIMIMNFNTENKFTLSNTSKFIASSLVSYSILPPLPNE